MKNSKKSDLKKFNKFEFSHFDLYQQRSRTTAIYPNVGNNFIYPTLGLTGEAGEVAEKIKKILRDKNGVIDKTAKREISKELGDVLWYLAQLASELDLALSQVALQNLRKLSSRKLRNKLSGSGDKR